MQPRWTSARRAKAPSVFIIRASFEERRKVFAGEGRPDRIVELLAQSVSVSREACAHFCFSPVVDKTMSRHFVLRRYFVLRTIYTPFFRTFGVFCSYVFIGRRHVMTQRCVPWAGAGLGYLISYVWARCVPCAVCHVCIGCMYCDVFSQTKRNSPLVQMAWVSLRLRTRVRAPATVFFFLSPPICLLHDGVLCSNIMITKGKSLSHSDSAG